MREIRAVIADDEPLARRGIRQLLGAHRDIVVVGECRDGREALRALDRLDPDLIFLDVQMPELDGFGVLRARGAERMPAVIFVTAFDEFAVRAFETHALDYLVKPVTEARFEAALRRVRERMGVAEALRLSKQLGALLALQSERGAIAPAAGVAEPRTAQRLVVPTSSGQLIIDSDEIDWIQAEDYYAAVHARGRRHLIRESLASLEQRLDARHFVRVHRSAIVRLDRIRELRASSGGDAAVVLRDGTRIPVSRRKREHVNTLLRSSIR